MAKKVDGKLVRNLNMSQMYTARNRDEKLVFGEKRYLGPGSAEIKESERSAEIQMPKDFQYQTRDFIYICIKEGFTKNTTWS